MPQKNPTIKGLFFNSHVKAVREKLGEPGIKKLEESLGHPLKYSNSDDVPVEDEVSLINASLPLLVNAQIPPDKRDYEAGKLHFNNFIKTPFANIIFSVFKSQFKLLMMNTHNIAGHIFNGMEFYSKEIGPKSVHIVIRNNKYPLDHFRGLFQAWMEYAGLTGEVRARAEASDVHEYYLEWQ
jgi:uncharacterized protein (TIGR02265 family)